MDTFVPIRPLIHPCVPRVTVTCLGSQIRKNISIENVYILHFIYYLVSFLNLFLYK